MDWEIKFNDHNKLYDIVEYRDGKIYGTIMCALIRELAIQISCEFRRCYWSGKYEVASKYNIDLRENDRDLCFS